MLVRKFEARTMKEALEMVKTQMGPDAIILSARDNKKTFGLVGGASVEITAAVSEATLQKKKFTETKFANQDKQKFQNSPARMQKEIIEKMVRREMEGRASTSSSAGKKVSTAGAPRQLTTQRYIEIEESGNAETGISDFSSAVDSAEVRVNQENASKAQGESTESNLVKNLQTEVSSLKQALSQFQKVPQQIGNSYPGSDFGLPYDMSFLYERMTREGVSDAIAGQFLYETLQKIPPNKMKQRSFLEGMTAKSILESTKISNWDPSIKFHVFMGPSGVGKTSTLVKMASHVLLHEKKRVGLITTDTIKVGAIDQMRIYAQILNVPFSVVRDPQDWRRLAAHFAEVDVVLVDFPALGAREMEQARKWQMLLPPANLPAQKHLVLSCTSKSEDMRESASRWSSFQPDDLIITNLDESVGRGVVFSAMKELSLGLFAFGVGSRVPDDFEFATKERVLDLIFKITEQTMIEHSRSTEWKG